MNKPKRVIVEVYEGTAHARMDSGVEWELIDWDVIRREEPWSHEQIDDFAKWGEGLVKDDVVAKLREYADAAAREVAMNSIKIDRMAEAAGVIRKVLGHDFQWEQPSARRYGRSALMLLLHEPGDPLRPYCDYACREYQKIETLSNALAEIGLRVAGFTDYYSGVYEITRMPAAAAK